MPRGRRPHLKQRPDGRYRIKYKGKYIYGLSEDEAYDNYDAYVAHVDAAELTQVTVSDYALPWLKRTYPAVRVSTYNGLATHLQHLTDAIGNKLLTEVVPSDIKDIYSTAYNGLSNSYILAAKQLYCALFDAAVADKLITSNPARMVKPHKGKKPEERILTPQEREWINTLCTDHRAHPAVMAMLYAGIRPQEMKAFDIDRDVDFENDIITVQETAHLDGQKYDFSGEMKTDWSKRTVPLFPPLKKALEGKHGHLITSAHGEKVTIQTWKVAWNSYKFCMETAINGIQKRWYGKRKDQLDKELAPWVDFDIVPYTLRHAFCQMCRDAEVDINTCRKWMGHADTTMILKVYDSVSDDRSESERKKIDSIWGSERGSDQNSEPSTR